MLALAFWMQRLSAPWLLVAAAGALAWSLAMRRERWRIAVAALLWVAVGVGAGVQLRLAEVTQEWPSVQAAVEGRAEAALADALDDLVDRGERAVAGAARAVGPQSDSRADSQLFRSLAALQRETEVSAVAVFDAAGAPIAWAGEHRGRVPDAVRRGERSYVFHEGPLFTYLYFVRPLEGERTAVAAVLVEANLSVGEDDVPFAERFAARHGLLPVFSLPERARGDAIWDWSTDRPILSVSFAAITQQRWWQRVADRGRWGVGAAWAASLLLLSVGWYRGRAGTPGVPVAVATLSLLFMPLAEMLGTERLFSPLQFVLPGPGDITLGVLLLLLIGLSLWLLTRGAGAERRSRGWVALQVGASALLIPLALALVRSSASGLLASRPGGGLALQLATALLLAIPLYLLLRVSSSSPRRQTLFLAAGVALPVLFGIALVLAWSPAQAVSPGWFALWAVPVALASRGLSRVPSRRGVLAAWLLAGWLGGTAAVTYLWPLHTSAKLESAARELARLGTEADPFLDFLLRQFAEHATEFAAAGEQGVNLLYHSWVASGLAREGYEARLTLWRGERPEAELRLSDLARLPDAVSEIVAAADAKTPIVQRFTDLEALHYLLLVPLPEDRTLSVAVPPRRRLGRATALARLLQPENEAGASMPVEALELIPVPDGVELRADTAGAVRWTRVAEGWRSEARVHFPSGWQHAHLFVRTSSFPMLLVNAVLAQAAILLGFVLLWAGGRMLCGDWNAFPLRWAWSFRGRLTLALFVFFLLPMTVFGTVAYSAVSREVVRSAATLARRALEQVDPEGSGGGFSALVPADLLRYRQGTLANGVAREALDLGLYHTWLPPEVFLAFAKGEDDTALEERRLAGRDYLVSYRRLSPAVVLAAPIPLASDEIRRRQNEFAAVALLMGLLGAGLSVVLSVGVGRALTRPIEELSLAAARVGGGDLRIHLPQQRRDEFGSVYESFNRMVRRLRHARIALVRETRRTEAIVAEAATGVLALDADGRVELVNPRAAEILDAPATAGERLCDGGPVTEAVAAAVERLRSAAAPEAGEELEVNGRVVRLRLRRLPSADGAGGAVVALEDITTEVRTARVLAWGEMARQVAHEIKNPLTPIKLSVQHLRRAFADGRADFGEILDRNVEAILKEIDRLGEIARAFSRFGTPAQHADPLQPVSVPEVVEEMLALYRGAEDGIEYRAEIDPATPLVTARTGELKEVLVNLLENARQALGGEGAIHLRAAPSADRGWVEVAVADTGEGIPEELLPRVFEPQFSTRTSGTGLGLAIVRRLVEGWGGEITAESEPGVETVMRLRLPVHE